MKLNSQALELFMISSLTGITLVLSGYIYSGLYGALNVGVGAAVSLINIQFYALIFWRIFTKKKYCLIGAADCNKVHNFVAVDLLCLGLL